ncbi:uncharacterized protein LOC134219866 [Armigeres subalbatus]|uniref:uncharacterized protein LOC134219866 n=1 Tax=Armigeres subalbatus TaxID=124917 RepID=UPI002ED600F1
MCMSATGHFVPPFVIFPRVRMTDKLKLGAPPGTVFSCNPSGWMTAEGFNKWFEHFIRHTKPSAEDPVLLILDGHSSHTKNLEFIDRARECNVHVLSLPPHCSHKLQPLDVSFMGPFKTYFSQAIENYLKDEPGKVVTLNEMSSLLATAYHRAARSEVAISGFRKTGIVPFNRFTFSDSDFVPATVTDIELSDFMENSVIDPEEAAALIDPGARSSFTAPANAPSPAQMVSLFERSTKFPKFSITDDESPFYGFGPEEYVTSFSYKTQTPLKVTPQSNMLIGTGYSQSSVSSLSTAKEGSFTVSPFSLRPLPKSRHRKRMSKRKTEKASILTSSPNREVLKTLQANKEIKQIRKGQRSSKIQSEKKRKKQDKENVPHDSLCCLCGDQFSSSFEGEKWNQCHRCHTWVHTCDGNMCPC